MPGNPTGRHRRGHSRERSNRPQRVRDSAEPRSHRRAELATQYGILGLIVLTPWALGTTVPWAIWGLNFVGWTLGLLLAAKHFIRRQQGFQPPCWEAPSRRWLPRAMTVLTFLVLAWCLVSALNGTGQRAFE